MSPYELLAREGCTAARMCARAVLRGDQEEAGRWARAWKALDEMWWQFAGGVAT